MNWKIPGDAPLPGWTFLQPYASAVIEGVKPWENRGRRRDFPSVGTWFTVHAGIALYRDGETWADVAALWPALPSQASIVRGCVLGVAFLTEVVPIGQVRDPWAFGPWCGRVGGVKIPAPIRCRGMQGRWPLPAEVRAALITALVDLGAMDAEQDKP